MGDPPPTTDERFPAGFRLRKQADFARVYARRCSASDGLILVYVAASTLDHPRIGLSVSRKVGGAVERNRWKRLLREAFRQSRQALPAGIDLIVIPRPGVEPELRSLADSLVRLVLKAQRRLTGEQRPRRD